MGNVASRAWLSLASPKLCENAIQNHFSAPLIFLYSIEQSQNDNSRYTLEDETEFGRLFKLI